MHILLEGLKEGRGITYQMGVLYLNGYFGDVCPVLKVGRLQDLGHGAKWILYHVDSGQDLDGVQMSCSQEGVTEGDKQG